jgi:hypothetical protein
MIVGAPVEERFAHAIRIKIQALLASNAEWYIAINFMHRFSGAEAESMSQSNLELLEQHDYFVSKKGTGLRCLLFIMTTSDGPAAFLVG